MKVITEGKAVFQQKIKTQYCGYHILALFIVFEVLLYIYKSNWILNSSSFLKYLAIGTLPIVIVVSLVYYVLSRLYIVTLPI